MIRLVHLYDNQLFVFPDLSIPEEIIEFKVVI